VESETDRREGAQGHVFPVARDGTALALCLGRRSTMNLSSLHIEQILCPTDFSIFSSRALRHAIALAQQFRARLKVVYVLPLMPNVGGSPFVPAPIFATPEERQYAEEEIRRFVEPARGSGIKVETEVREGQAWREILAVAEEMPADLVTMGTHGRSGFERFFLGSVTEKLLGRLPCPILTVCHEEGRTWEAPGLVRRILCATDFSAAAADALTLTLSLAETSGAPVTLLHVIDGLPTSDGGVYYAVPEIKPLRKALEEHAWQHLHAAVPEELPPGVQVEKRLAQGRAHEEILKFAAEQKADLIVLGTRGHGPLGRLLFGSTSARVVREASCPVLTVPPFGSFRAQHRGASTAATAERIPS